MTTYIYTSYLGNKGPRHVSVDACQRHTQLSGATVSPRSGLRPDVTGIFNFANHIREPGQAPIVTVPQQLRARFDVLWEERDFRARVPVGSKRLQSYIKSHVQNCGTAMVHVYVPLNATSWPDWCTSVNPWKSYEVLPINPRT